MNPQQSENARHEQARPANRKVVKRLLLVAVGMFGFGFAMWPIYEVFCDVTGLGGRSVQIAENNVGADTSDREIQIRFLATTNSALPWVFQPKEKTKTIKLGEMSETLYLAMNQTDEPVLGHATYNVVPPEASLYFVKTECFCFTEQLLQAYETREMPVYYYIQADLPDHIQEVTLSYTFYRNDNDDALAQAIASSSSQN